MKFSLDHLVFFIIGIAIVFNQCIQYNKIKKNKNEIINLKKNKELMTDTLFKNLTDKQKTIIRDFINEVYQADIDAIRNLSQVATTLQNKGLKIPGDLTVTGKFNYLPKGTIVAYNSPKAPPGWAICDGKNGTPDLRGRFIRMHTNGLKFGGDGNSYISANLKGSYASAYGGLRRGDPKVWRLKQNFGSYGGSDITKQDPSQLASHSHGCKAAGNHRHYYNDIYYSERGGNVPVAGNIGSHSTDYDNRGYQIGRNTNYAGNHAHGIDATGNGLPMNNQPSYYVLTWIMKL